MLISIPLRYMHTTVEMLHKEDIENTIWLMYETLLAIDTRYKPELFISLLCKYFVIMCPRQKAWHFYMYLIKLYKRSKWWVVVVALFAFGQVFINYKKVLCFHRFITMICILTQQYHISSMR